MKLIVTGQTRSANLLKRTFAKDFKRIEDRTYETDFDTSNQAKSALATVAEKLKKEGHEVDQWPDIIFLPDARAYLEKL
jgi:hypothetical protein